MVPNPKLKLSDLVLGLERFGERYGAIEVFADDLLEARSAEPIHGLRQLDKDGRSYRYDSATGGSYVIDVFEQTGVIRLSRATPPASRSSSDPGAIIAAGLAGAAVGAAASKKGQGAAAGLILGLLAGAALSGGAAQPQAPQRVFALRFDPALGQWRAYDGGLVPWMKENLLLATS
jgi:hypothetical protein